MATDDLFTMAATAEKERRSNVPEMSVSELAHSLKRTLEETYGRVRVRGELTGLKLATSGHLYGDVKDADSNINIVCWKGTMSKLGLRPADGLDVIITGKMTSFPKNSRYQLVIESMELAGEGALLKMLEDRRKALKAEGLFDEHRKRPLPFLPEVIGVVTSPTGAVIRDILHRIDERFPRHVILWPVAVQGENAASQIEAAIKGFNAIAGNAAHMPRPDLLIVARGGGSLEDLMAFNDERVVRAAANSGIPLISAVGHETDTTLIDYAADLRAPTPTGAAERAVPVRAQLLALVREDAQRLNAGAYRLQSEKAARLDTLAAKLGDPSRFLDSKAQHVDMLGARFLHGYEKIVSQKAHRLAGLSPSRPEAVLAEKKLLLEKTMGRLSQAYEKNLTGKERKIASLFLPAQQNAIERLVRETGRLMENLNRAKEQFFDKKKNDLAHQGRILETLSFERILERGYAVVRSDKGALIQTQKDAKNHDSMTIQFHDGEIRVHKG